MTTTASPAMIAGYINAMMDAFAADSAPGIRIVQWLRCDGTVLNIDVDAEIEPHLDSSAGRDLPAAEKPLPPWAWAAVRAALARVMAAEAEPGAMDRNLAAFAAALGIDGIAAQAFQFAFHASCEHGFDELCDDVVGTRRVDSFGLTAIALRCRTGDVREALGRGPLLTLGLVGVAGEVGCEFCFHVPQRIRRALQPPNDGLADIERCLIGQPRAPRLQLEDFAHVARERDFILRLLHGAYRARQAGINILLYGPPGTGKTELCKTVAAALGLDLFAVGETDATGDEPSRAERVEALRLADRLAARRANTVFLFDEMEDVQQEGERSWSRGRSVRRAGSKAFFNRLLEQNAVPVLWTANSLCEFDPAFLRRMTFACEILPPPAKVRERLWQGQARKSGLALSDDRTTALARRYRVAPSLIEHATQAVAAAGGSADEIEFVVDALARPLVGRLRPAEAPAPVGFVLELANADTDLAMLMAALTPGDFAAVARKLRFMGDAARPDGALLRLLEQEMAVKNLPRRIGF